MMWNITRKSLIISAILCCNIAASAQITVSINDCYSKAQSNHPLIKRYGLIDKARDYNLSNAAKGYLPQITFSAKATWQSDVTEIDIPKINIPNMPPISIPINAKGKKDQYGATVDVSQLIWDGGAIKARRESIGIASEVEKKSLKVDLYAITDRVNQIYFGILLFDAQLEQNTLFREELGRSYDRVSSCVQNGIAIKADLDAVKVEQLKAIQTESQLTYQKSAYLEMLSALVGEKLDTNAKLVKPEPISFADSIAVERPELELFDAMIKSAETRNKELQADLMPKFSVFATGGYGRPGLNMLKSDFSGYFLTGARLSWNFGSRYTNGNAKSLIQNNINSILTQQETFLFNVKMDIPRKLSDIDKYREQIKYDDDIIALRIAIRESSEAKMANGALSGIDLMRDVYAENLAKQTKIVHEIEWLLATYNLKFAANSK